MARTLFRVPDMSARMRETDPTRRKKSPQELEIEARNLAVDRQLGAAREGMQFQAGQSELARAAQEKAGRLRALTSVAAVPGAMQSAAAQQLMGQGGADDGETYEQRIARARQAYSDRVERSNAAMAQGQAKQNQLDAARIGELGKQGIDPRRMVWQAPGGQERSLSGQDTELYGPSGRTPEAYSQMVGTQGDLARQYPQAAKPAVNVIGLSKLQEATRQVAYPDQATAPAEQLAPEQYEQVRGSFSADAPVREPYTEGPGTAQGAGPAVPVSRDQQLARLQTQANRASGPGLSPIGDRIFTLNDPSLARNQRIARLSASSDPKMLAEAQKLKAEREKEVYKLRTELEQTFPDAMDRDAYIRGMGLSKFMGLSERAQAGPSVQASAPPMLPDRGAGAGQTALPVAGYNEGMMARTIDAGAPMSREDALKQYMARVQGQGQQAAGAEKAATERLAQAPYAAPGMQADPRYERMEQAKLAEAEGRAGTYRYQNMLRAAAGPGLNARMFLAGSGNLEGVVQQIEAATQNMSPADRAEFLSAVTTTALGTGEGVDTARLSALRTRLSQITTGQGVPGATVSPPGAPLVQSQSPVTVGVNQTFGPEGFKAATPITGKSLSGDVGGLIANAMTSPQFSAWLDTQINSGMKPDEIVAAATNMLRTSDAYRALSQQERVRRQRQAEGSGRGFTSGPEGSTANYYVAPPLDYELSQQVRQSLWDEIGKRQKAAGL
ncbi:MAG TPA: hypothetical protein VMW52_07080 [Phycisphaerae bacterium]|nr:hypothetical protein [Phycisphaerae bacterium]